MELVSRFVNHQQVLIDTLIYIEVDNSFPESIRL